MLRIFATFPQTVEKAQTFLDFFDSLRITNFAMCFKSENKFSIQFDIKLLKKFYRSIQFKNIVKTIQATKDNHYFFSALIPFYKYISIKYIMSNYSKKLNKYNP